MASKNLNSMLETSLIFHRIPLGKTLKNKVGGLQANMSRALELFFKIVPKILLASENVL